MYLRRRAKFSAGFFRPQADERGGHNYVCELTVGGTIDPRTGMVVNIKDVDAVLKAQVVSVLDGTLLDRDVEAFRNLPPTPENVARFVWDRCQEALPQEGHLARVTLWPTSTTWADLSLLNNDKKDQTPMLTLTRSYDFSASHRLHSLHLSDEENADIFGKCNWSNGHGHNYEVEVTMAGDIDSATGRLLPPEVLDAIVDEEVLKPYDHRHLNYDAPEFRDLNPTSENLTVVIWEKLSARLKEEPRLKMARLHKIVVRETGRNYFEYYGA